MNYQKIILVGNATGDAQIKKAKRGDLSYTTFGLGVRKGEEDTTFFPVTIFARYGETMAEWITKGRQVLVEGRVEVSDRGRFNVVANRVELGSRPEKPTKKSKKTK